uniref:RNA-directed DNA polymerase, eukaryota n=1 Tax=Tanacetum cinerariifolium TaxID=118510 RepID=A0A6L2MSJ5_TANCI|nr:RNA-directed DNA polymerase, eukaryota [Tanacetum cinerariifolium]
MIGVPVITVELVTTSDEDQSEPTTFHRIGAKESLDSLSPDNKCEKGFKGSGTSNAPSNIFTTMLITGLEWYAWFSSIRFSSKSKLLLEGTFFVAWWNIWRIRNRIIFREFFPDVPRHLFEENEKMSHRVGAEANRWSGLPELDAEACECDEICKPETLDESQADSDSVTTHGSDDNENTSNRDKDDINGVNHGDNENVDDFLDDGFEDGSNYSNMFLLTRRMFIKMEADGFVNSQNHHIALMMTINSGV